MEENIMAHDLVDKFEVGKRNQTWQVMHMPCTASTP